MATENPLVELFTSPTTLGISLSMVFLLMVQIYYLIMLLLLQL